MQKKKKEKKGREKAMKGEERGQGHEARKEKIYFLYVRSESKVHLQTRLGAARNLETCCCVHSKWRGGGKK